MSNASELKPLIERRIKQLVKSPEAAPEYHRQLAAKYNVLPLFSEWEGSWVLNPEGEVIIFPDDLASGARVEDDTLRRNTALVQGSKLYPELAALIPARPPDAQTCPDCGGSGVHPVTSIPKYAMIICLCGGTGWVPANFQIGPPG